MEFPDPDDFDSDEMEPELETRAEFSETLAQNGYHDVLVLSRERLSVFRHRRIEILHYLNEHNPDSVDELVEGGGFYQSEANNFLLDAAKLDIVEFDEGAPRLKHNRVVIEPIV